MGSRGEAGYGDDDRLPWLESVEEDYPEGPSIGRILLLILLALAVVGAVVFAYYWYRTNQSLSGHGELIEAQEGDYKVKPDVPGGMQVDGEGDSVFATSAGDAPVAPVATGRSPEDPIEGSIVEPTPTPTASGAPRVTLPVPQATMATPAEAGGGASVVQLGAFPDRSGATGAWQRLAKRYDYIASLGHSVEEVQRDGATLYRLRLNAGSAGQARELCRRLQSAGESCYVAN